MSKMVHDVVRFIQACEQVRTPANIELYDKLIHEEFGEYIDAKNDAEKLDACMDMIWVIIGYCHMKGWNIERAWEEVARSNLDKIDPDTGYVLKNSDGKVMKPKNWKAPALEQFVEV